MIALRPRRPSRRWPDPGISQASTTVSNRERAGAELLAVADVAGIDLILAGCVRDESQVALFKFYAEAMQVVVPDIPALPVIIRPPNPHDNAFFEALCAANRDLRLERTRDGEILIMSPAGGETGFRNSDITMQLSVWSHRDGRGRAFDSNTGYYLPNGASRSPDASWVEKKRLASLTRQQRRGFLPLCPDFVIELRSPSDRLQEIQEKMEEWIENGAQLAWLIDPDSRTVYVYRPLKPAERLIDAREVRGEGVVNGFVLNLSEIWQGLED